jgi:archaellum component FlaG (FlaF/FlaG flagellin family)
MRRGHVINFALAAFGVSGGAVVAAVIGLATDASHDQFWVGLLIGATVIAALAVVVALILALGDKEEAEELGRRGKMLPLIGMILCGVGLAGFGAWYFWPASAPSTVKARAANMPRTPVELPTTTVTSVSRTAATAPEARLHMEVRRGAPHEHTAEAALSPSPSSALKRLIAYDAPRIDQNTVRDSAGTLNYFRVASTSISNVGSDTITLTIKKFEVAVDGVVVITSLSASTPRIVAQTQSVPAEVRPPEPGVLIRTDAKVLTIRLEFQYDTIPPSGIRTSGRTFLYPVNWANGPDNAPLLNSPQVVDQYER